MVNEVNVAPVLAAISGQSVVRGEALRSRPRPPMPDLPANTLTFSLDAASAGLGMTIQPATGGFSWTPTAAQAPGSYDVTITVTDNGSPVLSDAATFTIVVTVTWQNSRHPCDVNGDGSITPDDVLRLINDINSKGSRDLMAASPPTPSPPPFLDSTGDGWIGPVDVLTVINYINAHGSGPIPSAPGGEGEYAGPIARDGREATMPLGLMTLTAGADSGTRSVAASTRPSHGQQVVWPASLQSASRAAVQSHSAADGRRQVTRLPA